MFVRVDLWFLGPDPVESAEVIGGRDPAVSTSADWTPRIGERYLVVADRATGERFVTKLCQQVAVDQAVLQEAASVFGPPREPPIGEAGTPQASSSPVASSPSGQPGASASGAPTAPGPHVRKARSHRSRARWLRWFSRPLVWLDGQSDGGDRPVESN